MLAIIPAKKYSKRLPNKNIKLLNKKPLIAYSIEAALKSKLISRVIVSTDSARISLIAKKFGAEVPFLRPKKLCKSNVDLKEVCKHTINFLEKKENIEINEIIILQPTSPLRKSQDIDKAIKIFKKKKVNFLTSINKTKPVEWNHYLNKNKSIFNIVQKKIVNSQRSRQTYILNGAIYIYKKKSIFKRKTEIAYSYEMPQIRSIDIDNLEEFNHVKYLISK